MGLNALPLARGSRRLLFGSGLALVLLLLLGQAGALAATGRRIGTKPSLPSGAQAVGALSQSTPLSVTVTLQPRDPAALAAYAAAVSTPGSSEYHHYLTVAEFARQFGPTWSAIAAAQASLRARGLTPGKLSANGLSLPVTASAARLASAFQTGFERYHLRSGRTAYANTSAPQVTGSGAAVVQSVIGLSNLAVEKPEGLARASAKANSSSSLPHTASSSAVTACSAANADSDDYGSYAAGQIASAYGFDGLYGTGDTGSGVTVGLYELEPYSSTDISAYQSCYGTSTSVSEESVDGGAGSGPGSGEAALDIEDVIGLAPGVHIEVYEGPNSDSGAYDTYAQMVSDDTVKVISTSWGLCESQEGPTAAEAENTLFQEAATQGQSVFSAAGDSGAQDCTDSSGNPTGGRAVDDPASQPYVTGVGGTSLNSISPISETVWNDGSQGGAGGGGVSTLWSMPSYQDGFAQSQSAIACGSSHSCREVPDVSADANEDTGYDIYWDGSWTAIGGTSAATPTWAAFTALAEASSDCAGAPLGFLNPLLYGAASSDYSADFNDVTSGDNSYDGVTGYSAGSGYDMASGLGSPKGTALAATICTGHDTVNFTTTAPTAHTTDAGLPADPFTVSAVSSLGKTPITYSATGLPPGVTINAATGTVSGTPTAGGTYAVLLDATDHYGTVGTESFPWTVITPVVTLSGVPASLSGRVGTALRTSALSALDSVGAPITYTATGLPAGLRINPSSGAISGTPTQAADQTVTIKAADPYSGLATRQFPLVVSGNPRVSLSKLRVSGTAASLTLTLRSGQYAPELKTVRLGAPKGARFSGRSSVLTRFVRAVARSGAQQAISRKVSGGRLTVTFSSATSTSQLKLSGTEFTLSKALAGGLAHRTRTLKLALVMTDASGTQTHLTLTLR